MDQLQSEVARATIASVVEQQGIANPEAVIEDMKVHSYENGDAAVTVKLNIPMARLNVTLVGADTPELVGCADSEL